MKELLPYAPTLNSGAAIQIAQEIYGLRATAEPLPSERDQNFLLQDASGKKLVLKIANTLEQRSLLDAQQAAMDHVSRSTGLCPRVLPAKSGETLPEVRLENGVRHFVRLVSYLPGVTLASVRRHSPELLHDLGRCMGKVDRALATFEHAAIHRDFHWDLAVGLRVFQQHHAEIRDEEMGNAASRVASDFERRVAPLLPELRRSAIHNDTNDHNVIVGGDPALATRHQRVIGLIDFGDMVHSYTVADLAIAIAYAVLGKSDPLQAAAHMVRGYHAEYPLTEKEVAALFGLVRMRLCMSLCIAAHQRKQRPGDSYLSISQEPIRATLPKLLEIQDRFAEAVFRGACGMAPLAAGQAVEGWLKANRKSFAPVLEHDVRSAPCLVFDLSVSGPLVSGLLVTGNAQQNAEPDLTRRLFSAMKSAAVKVGVGRYDEARLFYSSQLFATGRAPLDRRRVVHMGMDLFAEPRTAIHAPLAGTVYALANNRMLGDYGPVIILQHRTDAGSIFYTLYGHLSEESLARWRAGQPVAVGERLGAIGTPDVNGGWTPHLHFQVITDLLELDCDFPGVVCANQREVWRSFSPDPNLIVGVPDHCFPRAAPVKGETLRARHERLGRNLSLTYEDPIKAVRGWMQYLYDDEARKYLDAYNNVPHVGHSHPRVVRAASAQMAVLNTNTRYLHDLINEYARELCSTLPPPLSVCFFVNSGSEANELALRLARAHTKRRDMIVLEAAYHGHTTSLIDMSPYKHGGPGGEGPPGWVHTVPVPDVYRGAYRRDDPRAGEKYARHVVETIGALRAQLAGYIAESCPSVGGQIFFPAGYLAAVYEAVRAAGGVCIADEVQTGFGRIGSHFWAFAAQGVVPDMVVLGKPMGNGHPIGAVITTPEIAESFNNGMEFFSTFGGNTVSCAVGLEVLKIVRKDNLQSHALRVGQRLLEGLASLSNRYELIGDVRGSGLFLGVELVRDRGTLIPAAEEASFVVNRMRERGILLGTDGPYHNVIKIRPPMPFSADDGDLLLSAMDESLAEIQ